MALFCLDKGTWIRTDWCFLELLAACMEKLYITFCFTWNFAPTLPTYGRRMLARSVVILFGTFQDIDHIFVLLFNTRIFKTS